MKSEACRHRQEGAPMRRPTRPLRRLAAANCVTANLVRGEVMRLQRDQAGPSAPEAIVPWQPSPIATKDAPISGKDCDDTCTTCHKRKPGAGNKKVTEEMRVFPTTAIVRPLVKVEPLQIEEAFPKQARRRLAAPIRQPPCTRSQTLAALRLENAALKKGYMSMDCCWRRVLELHVTKDVFTKLAKIISEA